MHSDCSTVSQRLKGAFSAIQAGGQVIQACCVYGNILLFCVYESLEMTDFLNES